MSTASTSLHYFQSPNVSTLLPGGRGLAVVARRVERASAHRDLHRGAPGPGTGRCRAWCGHRSRGANAGLARALGGEACPRTLGARRPRRRSTLAHRACAMARGCLRKGALGSSSPRPENDPHPCEPRYRPGWLPAPFNERLAPLCGLGAPIPSFVFTHHNHEMGFPPRGVVRRTLASSMEGTGWRGASGWELVAANPCPRHRIRIPPSSAPAPAIGLWCDPPPGKPGEAQISACATGRGLTRPSPVWRRSCGSL